MPSIKFINELEKNHITSLYGLEKIIADDDDCEYLFEAANRVRQKFVKQEVHLKALIEISNTCARECFYCGLRSKNKGIKRYKMSAEEIVSRAKEAAMSGYKTVVMQSGESSAFKDDEICEIIREIKKFDVQITLSFGEKSFEQYRAYKKAGADRYLLRIETADRALYKALHPNMSLKNRIKCLENLRNLGYETGSGLLVGLPGSSAKILARDLMFLKKYDFDMIGIGPFIPAANTPLEHSKAGSIKLALKANALTRLLLPKINIPATTAIETLDPNEGRKMALRSGANVIMPSITQSRYRDLYKLYPNKFCLKESAAEIYDKFDEMLSLIGDKISLTNGNSVRFNQRRGS